MHRRVEMLMPDKRRVTRHQRANTKKPTTEEMQIMSKNVCHHRKFTPVVLRGLGTIRNSPHITRKIKAVTIVDWLGSFFKGRNSHRSYLIVHSSRITQKLMRQNILGLFIIIEGYLRLFLFHYRIIRASGIFSRSLGCFLSFFPLYINTNVIS